MSADALATGHGIRQRHAEQPGQYAERFAQPQRTEQRDHAVDDLRQQAAHS